MFIDADDYVNCTFDSLVTDAINNSVDIAVSGLFRVSRSRVQNCTSLQKNVYDSDNMFKLVMNTDTLSLGSPCCKIYKTDVIKRHNLKFRDDLTLFEDATFVYNYLKYSKSAMTSDLTFYCYDVKEVSLGGKYHGDVFWNCLKEYVSAQRAFVARFTGNNEAIDQLQRHHYISVLYNVLYAIYAIYRCENRPAKGKYKALKLHISRFKQLMGGVTLPFRLPEAVFPMRGSSSMARPSFADRNIFHCAV